MTNFQDEFFRAHRFETYLCALAGLILSAMLVVKGRFAAKASAWPKTSAKVENVFLDTLSRGPNRTPETHAVLAYSYSINDAYYSGEIRLWAGERSLETVENKLLGQEIFVHYDPKRPEASIFLESDVHDWAVVKDRRLSLWAWFENH
jgi:hypothetical protein